jgi:hypothetical protein
LGLLAAAMLYFVGEQSRAFPQGTTITVASVEGGDAPSKFEHGLQIFWRNTSFPGDPQPGETDPEARVRIFEGAKRELAVCHLARTIRSFDPDFTGVSIYDVSARSPGFIAVAAVYTRAAGHPVPLLLYFNWSGSLLKRIMLGHRPQIRSVEVTNAYQVWALNDFDSMNDSRFVFTAFDHSGEVIKEVVKPRRGWSTEESMTKGGQTSFGVLGNRVWAWLPKSQTFISFDTLSARAQSKHAGFPRLDQASALYARQAALLPDGRLLMDIGWIREGKRSAGWFSWSSQAGWQEVPSSSSNRYLYAVEGNKLIFTAFGEQSGSSPAFRSESISDLMAHTSSR